MFDYGKKTETVSKQQSPPTKTMGSEWVENSLHFIQQNKQKPTRPREHGTTT